MLTDHLLWTGYVSRRRKAFGYIVDSMQALAVAGAACCYKMAEVGGGKHVWDPIMTPQNLEKYLYFLWLGQILNLYGMALIKLSVCAYIFMLDFSKGFRIIIWVSVVIHLGINFIFPTVILFGECTPYSKHWDVTNTKPGSCWGAKPRVISGYSGAATNILTDMLYTLAPLVYIARVQLPKRTIWGVRAVFLCGLVYVFPPAPRVISTNTFRTTTISALKLYEMKSLNVSKDPTYDSVNLSIFAISEVFVGAFTASLPPLRKTFENLLKQVLPVSLTGASRTPKGSVESYELPQSKSKLNDKSRRREDDVEDDDSELGILPDEDVIRERKDSDQSITKTTHVSVTADSKSISSRRHSDWV